MQISSASLLAAQQQAQAQTKPRASVFGSFLNVSEAKPKEPAKAAFEPADFTQTNTGKTAAPDAPQGIRPPGSTLDIRV